jgi:hypothetical protein
MKKQRTPKTPRTFRTDAELAAIGREVLSSGDYWLMVGSGGSTDVILVHQPVGQAPIARVAIPRRNFNRLVDWYNGESSR